MRKISILKNICKLSIITSLAIATANAEGFEANMLGSTDGANALGGSYVFNKNIKLGLGILSINDLSTNANVKDDFIGLYSTLELKKEIYTNGEIFLDLSYITGKTDDTDLSIDKSIAGIGFKHNDDKYLSPYVGYTTENISYIGISKNLTEKWEIGIGGTHYFDNSDSSAFLTLSYNFGSGSASNITSSVKTAVEGKFNDKYNASSANQEGKYEGPVPH